MRMSPYQLMKRRLARSYGREAIVQIQRALTWQQLATGATLDHERTRYQARADQCVATAVRWARDAWRHARASEIAEP